MDWKELIGKRVRLFDGVLEEERTGRILQISQIENAVEIDWDDKYSPAWYNIDEAGWRFDLLEVIESRRRG